jgi:hypothetical protein
MPLFSGEPLHDTNCRFTETYLRFETVFSCTHRSMMPLNDGIPKREHGGAYVIFIVLDVLLVDPPGVPCSH